MAVFICHTGNNHVVSDTGHDNPQKMNKCHQESIVYRYAVMGDLCEWYDLKAFLIPYRLNIHLWLLLLQLVLYKINPSLTVGWLSVGAVWIVTALCTAFANIILSLLQLLYKFDDLALGLYKYFLIALGLS